MKALAIGCLSLETPVLLAPMASYTDVAFRRIVRSLGGVGLAYTPLLNPRSLLHGKGRKRAALLATGPDDRPLAWQLYGSDPEWMAESARWLEAHGAALIDINMGCPQRKIVRRGEGAGLLRTPARAAELVRKVCRAVAVPVSVKLRMGWDDADRSGVDLVRDLEDAGAAAIAVHGRTRAQGYSGRACWDAIADAVRAAQGIPVIGNGDVDSVEAARELVRRTGCAGVMVGRAALRNPWLIRDIANGLAGRSPLPAPGRVEWLRVTRAHFDGLIVLHGPKTAVLVFRQWLSQYAGGLGIPKARLIPMYKIEDADELAAAIGWGVRASRSCPS